MAAGDSHTGLPIYADTKALARLAKDIRAASPAAWKACRVGLAMAGEKVKATAAANASFSDKIPGSLRVKVGAGANVKVQAGGDAAPDAAAIENKGKGHVRHPVFGNREVWTSKNSPPAFLGPALDANRAEVAGLIEQAVGDAVQKVIEGR